MPPDKTFFPSYTILSRKSFNITWDDIKYIRHTFWKEGETMIKYRRRALTKSTWQTHLVVFPLAVSIVKSEFVRGQKTLGVEF